MEATGVYKNKKGEQVAAALPQPTLPQISLDDDDDTSTLATRKAPSTKESSYAGDKASLYDYPPPMPAYNPYSAQYPAGAPHYNMSTTSVAAAYDDPSYGSTYHDDDTAHLTSAAAPIAYAPPSAYTTSSGANSAAPLQHTSPALSSPAGLAYDESPQPSATGYPPTSQSQWQQQPYDNNIYDAYYSSSTPAPQGNGGYDGYGQSGAYSRRL